MHLDDQEKMSFMTEKGIYCYNVTPFGLKIVGATYQWLVNRMFKDQLGKTMEFYINDMLVNSEKAKDPSQTFDVLEKYKMRLNPIKCTFQAAEGKFLGHLVT